MFTASNAGHDWIPVYFFSTLLLLASIAGMVSIPMLGLSQWWLTMSVFPIAYFFWGAHKIAFLGECPSSHEWETQFLSPYRRCKNCPVIEKSHLSGFLLDGEWERITLDQLPEDHEWRAVTNLPLDSVPRQVLNREGVRNADS